MLPGPGMYRLPSDFGYYDINKRKKHNPIKNKKKKRSKSVE